MAPPTYLTSKKPNPCRVNDGKREIWTESLIEITIVINVISY